MDRPRRRLETPVGAATLLLGFEQPVRITRAGRAPETLVSVFCGPTTTPAVGEHGGRLSGIEVMLTPWAAFTLFGTPQYETADRVVDPDALDDVFARWWDAGTPCSARVVRAWSELVRTCGAMPVRRLAEEVGWSVRHLENRFREQIGLGPKAAARVLRLQRARRLLAAGRGQAATAAACGFYDQAHLSGEFKAMTGCTPREFTTARRLPFAAAPPGDRMDGEATSLILASGTSGATGTPRTSGTRGASDASGRSADFSKTDGTT
jgi:AraC-like DNA-binding protein